MRPAAGVRAPSRRAVTGVCALGAALSVCASGQTVTLARAGRGPSVPRPSLPSPPARFGARAGGQASARRRRNRSRPEKALMFTIPHSMGSN